MWQSQIIYILKVKIHNGFTRKRIFQSIIYFVFFWKFILPFISLNVFFFFLSHPCNSHNIVCSRLCHIFHTEFRAGFRTEQSLRLCGISSQQLRKKFITSMCIYAQHLQPLRSPLNMFTNFFNWFLLVWPWDIYTQWSKNINHYRNFFFLITNYK